MPDKDIFVMKIVLKKSIASLHRLTQAVQHANLRRTAGDPTWVVYMYALNFFFKKNLIITFKKKHEMKPTFDVRFIFIVVHTHMLRKFRLYTLTSLSNNRARYTTYSFR